MKSAHIKLTGRVQGVGFRFFTKQKAEELGIKGWVRNNKNGAVEINAEGDRDDLETFLQSLKIGPRPYAKVKTFNQEFSNQIEGYSTFEIKRG